MLHAISDNRKRTVGDLPVWVRSKSDRKEDFSVGAVAVVKEPVVRIGRVGTRVQYRLRGLMNWLVIQRVQHRLALPVSS